MGGKYLRAIDCRFDVPGVTGTALAEGSVLIDWLVHSLKVKVPTDGVAKVIVGNVAPKEWPPFEDGVERLPMGDAGDVVIIRHRLRHLNGLAADASRKQIKQALLSEVIHDLNDLCAEYGWDPAGPASLRAEVERRDYQFAGQFGRPVTSPGKRRKAQAAWRTDGLVVFGVQVTDKSGGALRWVPIVEVQFGLGLLLSLYGSISWIGDSCVRVNMSNKRDYWDVDVDSGVAAFHFPRAEAGDAHGQYELARMYIDGRIVEQDFDVAMTWLQRSAAQRFTPAVRLLARVENGETFAAMADPIKKTTLDTDSVGAISSASGGCPAWDYV